MKALPSHQRRKVAKRAVFLDKIRVASVLATKNSVRATKKKRAKKGLSASALDFATLTASLGEAGVDTTRWSAGTGVGSTGKLAKGGKVMSAKTRTKLVSNEAARLKQVLAHPEFVANPAAAVTNHVLAALRAANAAKKASGKAPRTLKAKQMKTAESIGAQREAREASDAVAVATANRATAAGRRGITERGGEDTRGPKDQLGVTHKYSNAKKGAGGKKGSKRSTKRARETW